MAIERTLSDVNQEDFDVAEAKLIAAILEYNPSVDLRTGTALRDLLIRQGAVLNAYNEKLNEDLRKTQSLKAVEENPELADDDVIEGILSNINVVRREGSSAVGLIIMTVDSQNFFTIPNGYIFETSSALQFKTLQSYRVRPTGSFTGALDELQLRPHTDADLAGKYYTIIPAQSVTVGSSNNISSGIALTTQTKLVVGEQTQESYNNFTGGADQETIEELLARVPTALGQKSMESEKSITSTLGGEFSTLRDLSAPGYGAESQLRDKHNLFGSAMGGKVDIYVKTADAPETLTVIQTANRISDGVYSFTLEQDTAPGAQLIRSITAPSTINPQSPLTGSLPIVGSYPFTVTRSTGSLGTTYHDFDENNLSVETAFSAYQTLEVVVSDVEPEVVDGQSVWPETLELKVEVYVPPLVREIQSYVDQEDTRNLKADQVVRSFVPFLVSVNATVIENPGTNLDTAVMQQALADYVNTKTFGDILTESQLECVLHNFDIVSVKSITFSAYTIDAGNNLINIIGPSMSIQDVKAPQFLVDVDTAMFTADVRDIFVTTVES